MERELVKITTPAGKELELKSFLTAGERNALRSVVLSHYKISPLSNEVDSGLTGSIVDEIEKKAIEVVVVSYDGSKENILGRLLDSSAAEYDFIVEQINKIQNFTMAK